MSEFAFDSRRKRSERLAQAPDLSFTNLDVLAAYARDRAKLPKAAVKRHPLTATVDCSAKYSENAGRSNRATAGTGVRQTTPCQTLKHSQPANGQTAGDTGQCRTRKQIAGSVR